MGKLRVRDLYLNPGSGPQRISLGMTPSTYNGCGDCTYKSKHLIKYYKDISWVPSESL